MDKGITMLDYAIQQITAIDKSLNAQSTRADALEKARNLGLSDFGELLISLPDSRFPNLSRLLPRMASAEVQTNWTGSSGLTLLAQTLDFVRSASYNYTRIIGESLDNKYLLDFGCGYGRISRLMYYFTEEANYYGVDPWNKSIEICNSDGLSKNFHISEYLPNFLPVDREDFDLVFAFSVFTHLSLRATKTCLNTLANYVKKDGVVLITIRPTEYWDIDKNAVATKATESLKQQHNKSGFAFLPHNREEVDGDITYGDTSMSLDWIREHFPQLKIVGIDRSISDPYQLYVFLQKS